MQEIDIIQSVAEVKEVISYMKALRGEWGKHMRLWSVGGQGNILGLCENIADVTDRFGGDVWRSNSAKAVEAQRYPGHSVGLIPLTSGSRLVVDFTRPGTGIIGVLSKDVHDTETSSRLHQMTGANDWFKR